MKLSSKPSAEILIALCTIGLGFLYFRSDGPQKVDKPPAAAMNAPPKEPSLLGAYADAPSAPGVLQRRHDTRELATPVSGSHSAEYDRLSRGTVAQQYLAYTMVEHCLETFTYRELEFLRAERCGDPLHGGLQPGQIASRVDRLKEPAEQGYPRAWYALDLESRGYYGPGQLPDTPETKAMLDRYRDIAIEHGDPRAIQTVLRDLEASSDPAKIARALSLQVAVLINLAQEVGDPLPTNILTNERAANLAKRLTPEQVRQALRDGMAIVNKTPKA